jgi:hypothetical protein
MSADRAEYARFVERFAPLGYARLFAWCGDFVQAQQHLERFFADGYSTWERRHEWGHDPNDIFAAMMEHTRAGASPSPSGEAPYTFAKIRKLQDQEQAVAILRSFKPEDMIPLFLLYVEEVPPATIRLFDLVGETVTVRTSGDCLEILDGRTLLVELDKKLAAKIAEWKPGDREATELFRRVLRQHKLPATFVQSVMARAASAGRIKVVLPGIAGSILRAALCCGITVAAMGAIVSDSYRPYYPQEDLRWMPLLGLFAFADVLILAVSWRLRKAAAAGIDPRVRIMRFLDYVGLVILTTAPYFVVTPYVFERHPGLFFSLLLGRLAWWFLAVSLIATAGVRLLQGRKP